VISTNCSQCCPSRELEEITRAFPYHVAEHPPMRSESIQPYTERSSRPGSEPPFVEADVYIWCYALLAMHARKEEEISVLTFVRWFDVVGWVTGRASTIYKIPMLVLIFLFLNWLEEESHLGN